jgi:hypothetical protein
LHREFVPSTLSEALAIIEPQSLAALTCIEDIPCRFTSRSMIAYLIPAIFTIHVSHYAGQRNPADVG